jgi:hypothetical protein
MAGQNAEWTHRKQIKLDHMKYEIGVTESGGVYSATWVCLACGERGASALKSSSAEQAIERAQANLYAHHTLVHSESSSGDVNST